MLCRYSELFLIHVPLHLNGTTRRREEKKWMLFYGIATEKTISMQLNSSEIFPVFLIKNTFPSFKPSRILYISYNIGVWKRPARASEPGNSKRRQHTIKTHSLSGCIRVSFIKWALTQEREWFELGFRSFFFGTKYNHHLITLHLFGSVSVCASCVFLGHSALLSTNGREANMMHEMLKCTQT